MRSCIATAVLALPLWQSHRVCAQPNSSVSDQERVGVVDAGRIITPVNQVLTPYGRDVDLPDMRPQAVALSPNGKLLVTAGKTSELVVIDPVARRIQQRVPLARQQSCCGARSPVSEQVLKPDKDDQLSFNGLIFSPSGDRIYMSNVRRVDQCVRRFPGGQGHAPSFLGAAGGRRTTTRGGNPKWAGDFRRWNKAVRLRQSFQPIAGTGHANRQNAANIRRRRGALRCRARRREGIRQQLGRTSTRAQRSYRAGRPRHVGARRSGEAHCQ